MTIGSMIELAVAVLILGVGVWLYRARKAADQGYGSQGAVLLFVVGAIMALHALGAFEYRPTQGELDYVREQSQ